MISLVLNKTTTKAKSQSFQESRIARRLHYLLGRVSLSTCKTFLTVWGRGEVKNSVRRTKEKKRDKLHFGPGYGKGTVCKKTIQWG